MKAQAHLPVHTALELCLGGIFFFFHCAYSNRPQKPYGLLGTGGRTGEGMKAQAHLPVHTVPQLWLGEILFF